MYKINLKEIEGTNLVALDTMYLGSFIKDNSHPRGMDFYSQRVSIFRPEDFNDPISKAMATCLNEVYQSNELPTIKNLVDRLSTKAWFGGKDGVASDMLDYGYLNNIVNYYSTRGAQTVKEFRSRERAMEDAKRAKLLAPENLNKVILEIMQSPGTSVDHAISIKQYMDNIVGGAEFAQKTTDWNEQKHLLETLPAEFAKNIGKARFTFPPHWKLNEFIPVLRPGEKCVLSGGTGDGKSACAMMFAEWAAICGKNVLVIHMEDSDQTILMRQTVRWIGGTFLELERGDPKGRMNQMIKLREWWNTRGGSLTYKYLAGNNIGLIVEQIKETAATLESQDKHLDVVVFDYFQKIDFDSGVGSGGNYVNQATAGAEALKILAERLQLFMFVVSQETPDANGGKHTAWARALEQKPQIYISLTRQEIKKSDDEEVVSLVDPESHTSRRIAISSIGDRSCWLMMQIKKVNNGRQGISWLYFDGPRFRAFDPEFMQRVDNGEIGEFDVPVLKSADKEFWARQDEREEVHRLAYYQLKNPDQRRIEKMQAKEEEYANSN